MHNKQAIRSGAPRFQVSRGIDGFILAFLASYATLCAKPCGWPSLPCAKSTPLLSISTAQSLRADATATFFCTKTVRQAGSRTGLYSSVEGYAVVMVGIGLASCCMSCCRACCVRVCSVLLAPRSKSSQFSILIFPVAAKFPPLASAERASGSWERSPRQTV